MKINRSLIPFYLSFALVIALDVYLFRELFRPNSVFSGDLISGYSNINFLKLQYFSVYDYSSSTLSTTNFVLLFQSFVNTIAFPGYYAGEKIIVLLPMPLGYLFAYRLTGAFRLSRNAMIALSMIYTFSPLMIFNSLYVEPPAEWLIALFPAFVYF